MNSRVAYLNPPPSSMLPTPMSGPMETKTSSYNAQPHPPPLSYGQLTPIRDRQRTTDQVVSSRKRNTFVPVDTRNRPSRRESPERMLVLKLPPSAKAHHLDDAIPHPRPRLHSTFGN